MDAIKLSDSADRYSSSEFASISGPAKNRKTADTTKSSGPTFAQLLKENSAKKNAKHQAEQSEPANPTANTPSAEPAANEQPSAPDVQAPNAQDINVRDPEGNIEGYAASEAGEFSHDLIEVHEVQTEFETVPELPLSPTVLTPQHQMATAPGLIGLPEDVAGNEFPNRETAEPESAAESLATGEGEYEYVPPVAQQSATEQIPLADDAPQSADETGTHLDPQEDFVSPAPEAPQANLEHGEVITVNPIDASNAKPPEENASPRIEPMEVPTSPNRGDTSPSEMPEPGNNQYSAAGNPFASSIESSGTSQPSNAGPSIPEANGSLNSPIIDLHTQAPALADAQSLTEEATAAKPMASNETETPIPQSALHSTRHSSLENTPRAVQALGTLTSNDSEANPVEAMVSRIGTSIVQAHEGGKVIRMRMHPPELGVLQIEVTSVDGSLTARLDVDNARAHRAILENLPQLHEMLHRANTHVDRIELNILDHQNGQESPSNGTSGSSSQGQNFGEQTSPRPLQQPHGPERTDDPLPGDSRDAKRQLHTLNGIDIRA